MIYQEPTVYKAPNVYKGPGGGGGGAYDPIIEYEPAPMPDGRIWTTKNLYIVLYNTKFGNTNSNSDRYTSFVAGTAIQSNIRNAGLAYNFLEVQNFVSNKDVLFPGWNIPTKTELENLRDSFGGNLDNNTFKLQKSATYNNGSIDPQVTQLWTRTSIDASFAYALYWRPGLVPNLVRGEYKRSLFYIRLIKDV